MTPVTVGKAFLENPVQWLGNWRRGHGRPQLPYLLAHTDDGVVWGLMDDKGKLSLSYQQKWRAIDRQAELEGVKVQQLRLFGPAGELFIWRVADDLFAGRLIADGATGPEDSYEEYHLLWGSGLETSGKFTLMRDGEQGLFHAPPLPQAREKRARLKVRHYVAVDERQQAYADMSRLVDLEAI